MSQIKLKGKLIIAFLTIIIIPILLISAAGGALLNYQLNSIQQNYDMESNTMQLIANPIQILNRVTRGTYNEIKLCALKTPEKFSDSVYIDELNNTLKRNYSFIALRKNGEFIYVGNEKNMDKVKDYLPKFGVYNLDVDGGMYVGGKNSFLVKQQDFYFDDGAEGSVFVITDVNTVVPQIKSFGIQFGIAFIIIILFTASILTFWIYRGILRPLNCLRRATNKMKDGNLNYSVPVENDDEVGLLCQDFEEMRIQLKDLIDTKMQYEVDSRELISNISHDLKTPLTAIKGYAEGILDGVADTKEKQEKYLRTIYTKANDMTHLVDELSFYSKIDCNTVPYNFVNLNINDYFIDCIDEVTLDLEVKNIKIDYHNEADTAITVVADPEQLKRVVNNIIGNCSKYMEKEVGEIHVKIQEDEEFMKISISDNGKGISQADLPYIFERFYRADASRNSRKGGSGLGLAIVKKIVEDHNGAIWAESEEGKGTSIIFTLKKSKPFLPVLETNKPSKHEKHPSYEVKE